MNIATTITAFIAGIALLTVFVKLGIGRPYDRVPLSAYGQETALVFVALAGGILTVIPLAHGLVAVSQYIGAPALFAGTVIIATSSVVAFLLLVVLDQYVTDRRWERRPA